MNKNQLLIARKALPIILANATVPLLGLADTAAIGQVGGARELGAIALGALVFSFVYWGFGFLRMGTTGFTAQALGAKDVAEIRAVFTRSMLLGLVIGLLLIVLQQAVCGLALWLMNASDGVKALVKQYFYVRIWGAPATLGMFALLGTLIGLGHTRQLLLIQLFLNGLNISLNLLFVLGFGWGVRGIAAGTVIAEWFALLLGLWIVSRSLAVAAPNGGIRLAWSQIFRKDKFIKMLKTNSDIMLRTLALLAGFAWFTDQGAQFGDVTLAANHILLQFVSLSAFFLDGYAYVVEMMVGKAIGAKDRLAFIRDVRDSTQLAGFTALMLALLVWFGGDKAIGFLTQDIAVRSTASLYLSYAALYVMASFIAFQLDGVFIGATRSAEMRNASVFSLLIFIGVGIVLVSWMDNSGLWIAFVCYVLVRGISLAVYIPRILNEIKKKHLSV
ncbi:MATE family efflux transporter [Olivibacter sp. SDN3]|uniref:MATE family efflux transporter n=1 Tax=Olivibacter sp. SDN3 TaxID=2764720 RepID=UPI001C9E8309|nr:MATE family efflux transporter [Olivibacter sp. SDN3]